MKNEIKPVKVNPVIFGISGTKLTKEEISFFTKNQVLGFILFARNIESKEQLLELTYNLRALYDDEIMILVDQEGGRVQRIKPPIVSSDYHSGEYFSDLYDKDREDGMGQIYHEYFIKMDELIHLGIDCICGPVCDIRYEYTSDAIGDRAFGDNADKVFNLAGAAIEGINESGGTAIMKHIPGHGRSKKDSHIDLPIVKASLEELNFSDFAVFKNLSDKVDYAMTAHIIFTALDKDLPITISKKSIEYIRKKICFDGKIITDDIGMYALHGEIGVKKMNIQKIIRSLESDKTLDHEINMDEIKKFLHNENLDDDLNLDRESLIEICKKNLGNVQIDFCNNLSKVANCAIEAGCDIILHCSGNLQEMQAVIDGICL